MLPLLPLLPTSALPQHLSSSAKPMVPACQSGQKLTLPRVHTARCGETREACIPRGLVSMVERQEKYLDRHLVESTGGTHACPHQPCAGELSFYTSSTHYNGHQDWGCIEE